MSMEKLRYGTKEIIATICAVILIIASRWAEILFFPLAEGVFSLKDWVMLRVLVVSVAAVFFGPATGLISGLSGDLLINMVFGQAIDYTDMTAMGLYGLFLGLYFGKTHFNIRSVDIRSVIDFNVVQLLAGVFLTLFFIPMLKFLTGALELNSAVISGAKYAVGNALLVGIVCPLIMCIVSAVVKRTGRRTT